MLVTEQTLPDCVQWLDAQHEIGIDTETTGLDPYRDGCRICGISMAGHDGSAVYLPFRHKIGANLELGRLRQLTEYLSARVTAGTLRLIFWNAKFDLHMLAADGFEPPVSGGIEDAMLGAHLLNENEPSFALKSYADKYELGRGSADETELRTHIERLYGRTEKSTWKGEIWKLAADTVAPYAEQDAVLTLAVAVMIRPALDRWKLTELYADVNAYNLLVWRMERRGVRLDIPAIEEQMSRLGPTKDIVNEQILQIVEARTGERLNPIIKENQRPRTGKRGQALKVYDRERFNPGSPSQVAALTGWEKTDVRYLEELEADDPDKPLADLILDYRVLSKMSGTYYDAYLSLTDAHDVIRPNYNLHGTVNGRASCSKPNLQNVPRYTERRPVKNVFVPRDGYVFVETDYSQAELRIATHYANEERMRAIFHAGGDPHGETATKLGIPRFVAKTLNFLIIYGGGVPAIVKTLKCSPEEGRAFISGYHALYPGFQKLSNACSATAEKYDVIRMPTGRLRHFNTWKRYKYESDPRKAMNSLIQGTAAEMLRVAMQRLDDAIRAESLDAHLLLQVHDSLLAEVRPEHVARYCELLNECMLGFHFDPAPAIDAKYGSAWAPMTELALGA